MQQERAYFKLFSMLKDIWQEAGRLESIFLEIIEDPTKKEVLLYPICYCQLVRKENSFEIDLPKLISCANKTFHTFRGRWQDILLELDLFQLITFRGDVLYGKDILKIQSPEGFRVSFLPEYREIFYEVYSRFLKYWTVLSKVSSYSKRNTPAEGVYLSALIFNEELYTESVHFAGMQSMRFPDEEAFFCAVRDLSEFYVRVNEKREFCTDLLEKALSRVETLKSPYYGVNTAKLRKDIESLIRDITRGRKYFILKISFTVSSERRKRSLRAFIEKILRKIEEFGRRKLNLMKTDSSYFSLEDSDWKERRSVRVSL